MPKFISKPVVVEAHEIVTVGEPNSANITPLELDAGNGATVKVSANPGSKGQTEPKVGDWWIKRTEADQYVCPKEVFEEKYEPFNEETNKPAKEQHGPKTKEEAEAGGEKEKKPGIVEKLLHPHKDAKKEEKSSGEQESSAEGSPKPKEGDESGDSGSAAA